MEIRITTTNSLFALLSTLTLTGALAAGCGSGEPGDGEGTPTATPTATGTPTAGFVSYLPLKQGATWTWQTTDADDAEMGSKTSTVEARETVPGGTIEVWRVRSVKEDGDYTISWQQDTGTQIVRHREEEYQVGDVKRSEESYDPGKLRIDVSPEKMVVGATWSTTFNETIYDAATGTTTTHARSDQWTVEALDESVSVPAGTFQCLRIRRIGTEAGQSDKTFWFAQGVGKVKEAGGQEEVLMSYSIR